MYRPDRVPGPVWTKSASSVISIGLFDVIIIKQALFPSRPRLEYSLSQKNLIELFLERPVIFEKKVDELLGILKLELIAAHVFRHAGSFDQVGAPIIMLLHDRLSFLGNHEGNEQFGQIGVGGIFRHAQRSEEHTSELQSPDH